MLADHAYLCCLVSAGWNTYNAAYLAAFRKKYQTNLLTYVSCA